METSESIKEIATAMNKAQAEMTAAKIDSSNPFFKSSYADMGAVIKAIKGPFYNNGLSHIQSPEMDANGVGVTTMIMHVSGEWIRGTLHIPMAKKDPQGAGSAITYARRYSLQAMAGLPSADDDAEFSMSRSGPESTDLGFLTTEQLARLRTAIDNSEGDVQGFCNRARISNLNELEATRFDGAMKSLAVKTGG